MMDECMSCGLYVPETYAECIMCERVIDEACWEAMVKSDTKWKEDPLTEFTVCPDCFPGCDTYGLYRHGIDRLVDVTE